MNQQTAVRGPRTPLSIYVVKSEERGGRVHDVARGTHDLREPAAGRNLALFTSKRARSRSVVLNII